jgi:CheY-like chemotaxis protein
LTGRVLVVDDEKSVRTTLAGILENRGYEVSTADCGEKAIKLCGRVNFDVVLMDVRMPGIDGFEAMRRIKSNGNHVRVIMMSPYDMGELQRTALEAGAAAFLRKPLNVDHVARVISASTDRNGVGSP